MKATIRHQVLIKVIMKNLKVPTHTINKKVHQILKIKHPHILLTRLPRTPHTKLPGINITKLPSTPHTTHPRTPHTKLPGIKHTRRPLTPHTRIPRIPLTKIPRTLHTKLPGIHHTRLPLTLHTRIPRTFHILATVINQDQKSTSQKLTVIKTTTKPIMMPTVKTKITLNTTLKLKCQQKS